MKRTVEVEILATPVEIAAAFCDLDDEGQAQVFIEIAKIAAAWTGAFAGPGYQWWLVGRHLRNCECSTEEARDVVREIANGIAADVGAEP